MSTLKNIRLQTYPDENQESEHLHNSNNPSEQSHESIDVREEYSHKFFPSFIG